MPPRLTLRGDLFDCLSGSDRRARTKAKHLYDPLLARYSMPLQTFCDGMTCLRLRTEIAGGRMSHKAISKGHGHIVSRLIGSLKRITKGFDIVKSRLLTHQSRRGIESSRALTRKFASFCDRWIGFGQIDTRLNQFARKAMSQLVQALVLLYNRIGQGNPCLNGIGHFGR